jgi:chromosome segregation ATPase
VAPAAPAAAKQAAPAPSSNGNSVSGGGAQTAPATTNHAPGPQAGELKDLRKQVADLTSQITSKQATFDHNIRNASVLQAERDAAFAQAAEKHQESVHYVNEKMDVETSLEKTSKELFSTKAELAECKAAYNAFKSGIERDEKRVAEADSIVSKVTEEKDDLAKALANALRAHAGYQSNIDALKEDVDKAAALHEHMALMEETAQLHQRMAEKERKLNSDLKKEVQRLEGELAMVEL